MADFRVPSSIVGFVWGIARPLVLEESRRRGAAEPIFRTEAIDPDLRQFSPAFEDAGFHGGAARRGPQWRSKLRHARSVCNTKANFGSSGGSHRPRRRLTLQAAWRLT
jgi:hypothetical protein